jgi:hypothetical protein
MVEELQIRYKPIPSLLPSINNETDKSWELVFLRNTRNSLLQLTDKYLLSDYPISDEKRYEIIEYRQYLRNFININQEAILNGVIPEILPIPF